ncbi:Peptidase_C39 like family protein [Microlunatus flavus]|uniref:Peptidase_C39 like family protein n=2 Tax=Microlunatus flavus TaxID=1036181 RepID=A0A1H9JG05_9ACTN|nr:Peptidase_C39 like family protein [Microlunatus flavus]
MVLGVTGAAVLLGAQPAFAGGPPTSSPAGGAAPAATTDAFRSAARSVSAVTGPERSLVVGVPTLTADQQASVAAKDAAVARVLASSRRAGAARLAGARSEADDPLPSHRSIKAVKQKAQSRSYWCGPATLQMLALADGAKISQKTAAKRLKTTSSGTNWYSGAGNYPMERALERYSDGFDYTPQNLAYTPSDADVATFRDRLVADIAVQRQGIAGNAVEVRNGPHLNGHPNRTIYHWVAVRGYDDDGDTTRYADSVAGSSISWAAPVPRYNEIDTDKIVTIFGARGYVW